jgi:threonine aldolase
MHFASDNTGPVHPRVLEALARANEGYALPYGNDALWAGARTASARSSRRPRPRSISSPPAPPPMRWRSRPGPPWGHVFCHRPAHIAEDECGAPEFYSGGAKLTLVDGADGKIDPDPLAAAIAAEESRGVHGPQRGPGLDHPGDREGHGLPLEPKSAPDRGRARRFGLPSISTARASPMRWSGSGLHAGRDDLEGRVDAVSFGGTKNGLMGVEAVVIFDPAKAWEFELRRKRGGHLFSKHRYLAAQMEAYLEGDLWLDMAGDPKTPAIAACSVLRA